MKFQSFTTAWKKDVPKPKEGMVKQEVPVLNTKDIVVVKDVPKETVTKEIVLPKEIIIPKETMVPKERNENFIEFDGEETNVQEAKQESVSLFYKPQSFKDYIIITLIIIIFLLFLWNLNSTNEVKRLYKTQEKILEILLQRLVKD